MQCRRESSIKLDSDLSIILRRQQLNATQSINYDLFKSHIRYINALSDNHSQVFVQRSCMLFLTNSWFIIRQLWLKTTQLLSCKFSRNPKKIGPKFLKPKTKLVQQSLWFVNRCPKAVLGTLKLYPSCSRIQRVMMRVWRQELSAVRRIRYVNHQMKKMCFIV